MLENEAYLECPERRIPLDSPFRLGRSKSCALPLTDPQASREHAMIVWDKNSGHWMLSDLSSTNGTYLNGRRLIGTERLKSGDSFSIGKQEFTFHASSEPVRYAESTMSVHTILAIEKHAYWLVLADIKNSSKLSQELPPEELSRKIRQWIDECKPALGRARFTINEYLGDGFLAVSRELQTTRTAVAGLLRELDALHSATGLEFRFVAHYGELQVGAGVSSGVEKLSGRELNFAFKSEKAVSSFGVRVNVTENALQKMPSPTGFRKIGEAPLSGFDGVHAFYTLQSA